MKTFWMCAAATALCAMGCGGDDASTVDAGGPDAGAADAGRASDAGGVTDAGGATDASPSDAGSSSDCSPSCSPTQVCVRSRTLGGGLVMPDDAGMCPAGRHPEGDRCVADFALRCDPAPTCDASAGCSCLSMLCAPSFMCTSATASSVTCEQLAP